MELGRRLFRHQRVFRPFAFHLVAEGEVADPAHRMHHDDLLVKLIHVRIARQAQERRQTGTGRQHEQPLARQQRVGHQRTSRLAAEVDLVARLDLLELAGQRTILHLDRQEFDFLVPGRAGDRVSAQQRLAIIALQADHDELARPEAETGGPRDAEAEKMLVPMLHRQHGFHGKRAGGFQNRLFDRLVGQQSILAVYVASHRRRLLRIVRNKVEIREWPARTIKARPKKLVVPIGRPSSGRPTL